MPYLRSEECFEVLDDPAACAIKKRMLLTRKGFTNR